MQVSAHHKGMLILLFACVLSALVSTAHAESVQWSKAQPDLYTYANGKMHMWLDDAMVTVTYNVAVWRSDASGAKLEPLADNASVPTGTYVLYEFVPHVYTDIYWFGTGGSSDSPYGDWVQNDAQPDPMVRCHPKNLYTERSFETPSLPLRAYAALGVDEPTKTLSVSTGECATVNGSNKLCRFDSPATVSAQFTFNATNGLFWGGWRGMDLGYPGTNKEPRCFDNGLAFGPFAYNNSGQTPASSPNPVLPPQSVDPSGYRVAVPTQTVPHTLAVLPAPDPDDPTTGPPSTPALSSSGSCVVGSAHTISFVSTDPDGDNLRYGIDWNADGSIDQWVPPSGYVASGTTRSASRTYSTEGEKSVKVLAQDEGGLSSSWATLSFDCANSTATTGLQGNNSGNGSGGGNSSLLPTADLDLRVIPSLVRSGDTTQVNWSAQHVQSCTISARNGDSWSGTESPIGGETSSPITTQTTYTLSCIDLTGAPRTETATVHILPRFEEV